MLTETFADLGMSPLSNSYLKREQLQSMEPFYPLRAYVCGNCFLVQLAEFESPDQIFSQYAYFSSYSDSWVQHCRKFAQKMIPRCELDADSLVLEIASNDGSLLQFFMECNIPVLGIEPAANVAKVALRKGIPTEVDFFGESKGDDLAQAGNAANLIVANNVLAHVPDIIDFVKGFKRALKPAGRISVEFPHLLRLIQHNQFDTIYHEHFSYLSLGFVTELFSTHGLQVFDVEKLTTHGGSLRVHACHAGECDPYDSVRRVLAEEQRGGLRELSAYRRFSGQVVRTKCDVLNFFLQARRAGKRVACYGAPAKGNTLLNYCGIGPELIEFTVDRSPHKQGLFLPGTHIPILAPEAIARDRPDFLFILPWNLREEIAEQMTGIRAWGGKFVVPIPKVEVF